MACKPQLDPRRSRAHDEVGPTNGFTLAELIVSVTITSILMLGLSVFFSSTFSNLFRIQTQSANTERQFAVNEIIRDKFNTLQYLVEEDPGNEWILSFNQTTKGQLPFSYIGSTDIGGNTHLAFKDLMIFNKIFDTGTQHQYSSGGDGKIKNANGGGPVKDWSGSDEKNFTGFAYDGSYYYVAFPTENIVKKCDTSCADLPNLTGDFQLNHPTDVAIDAGGNNLYISDSGNSRIIKYVLANPALSQRIVDVGLNFPTGLSYYQGPSGDFLFIADTFNHKIKRVNVPSAPYTVETIAGSGTNEDCSGTTAKFCKLNLPTGLFAKKVIGPPEIHELYIADSGNNRILKISDPGSADLNDFEIKFNLESNTRISRIDFVFPNGSTLTNITESQANALHKGKYDIDGTILKYKLMVPIGISYLNNSVCETPACPPNPKTNYFDSFGVLPENNIFEATDKILFGADPLQYTAAIVGSGTLPHEDIEVTPNDQTTVAYAPGTIAKIDNDFASGEYRFNFDLSQSAFPPGFQNITIKIYDENQQLLQESNIIMRMGDGELGTEEDIIEVLASGAGIKFPTGISDQYFINSGESEVWNHSPPALVPGNVDIIDTTAFQASETHSDFDYISDFTVTSIIFDKHNPNQRILELEIIANIDETNTQTYKLNAILPPAP